MVIFGSFSIKMISITLKYFFGALIVLLMASPAVSAEMKVGEATLYSGKKLRTGEARATCELSKQWQNRQAILSEKDFEKVKDPCNKCVVINGVATSENSRRFNNGVYAKIADVCSGKYCEKGSLRLSSSVMKAIASNSQNAAPVVDWEVVECPRTSNLRGRKNI